MQPFDPNQEYAITERRLPHWSQAGTLAFVTWRTWDSMPADVVAGWCAERDEWLRNHGIPAPDPRWQALVRRLDPRLVEEFRWLLSDRWNDRLDECHGSCVLRQPELAAEVSNSLRHFNGERYELTDFVVMPNHLHILASFPDEKGMLSQCESWKHYTASRINKALNRKGRFWEQDAFDHLVRSLEQFEYLRRYISNNPREAGLRPGEYVTWSSNASTSRSA